MADIKLVLTAVNSSYIHTNLAVRILEQYAGQGINVSVVESTINDDIDMVCADILYARPDVIGFSCYIWNIDYVLKICSFVHEVMPQVPIVLGGPEAGFNAEKILKKHPWIAAVVKGEGEAVLGRLVHNLAHKKDISDIEGVITAEGGKIKKNESCPVNMMDYRHDYAELEQYKNRILYYESSRGCPYSCSYCLSSSIKGLRMIEPAWVLKDMERFLQADVKQVKFVDRTFNADRKRAACIWRGILELKEKYPESSTNFHFEVSGSLIDDETIEIMSRAPQGLIQLEIGLQTVTPQVLDAISRRDDHEIISRGVLEILSHQNVHVHMDLIAGLPLEDINSFAAGFDYCITIGPQMLQLGFLKVLPGTKMAQDAEKYGIRYRSWAPYEVLFTSHMSAQELLHLKRVSDVLEMYYNSGHMKTFFDRMAGSGELNFRFFSALADWFYKNDLLRKRHSDISRFELMLEFLKQYNREKLPEYKELLRYDWACMQRPARYPSGLEPPEVQEDADRKRDFYKREEQERKYLPQHVGFTSKQLGHMCQLEWMEGAALKKGWYLFEYMQRNPVTGRGRVTFLGEEI